MENQSELKMLRLILFCFVEQYLFNNCFHAE